MADTWQQFTQDAAAQASAGRYAGGDLLLYMGVFGVLALIPTALAVYFVAKKFLTR
ncbi:MAG TPA: hypothetical protein VFD54_10130 [Anaerolineales bacterium]|nr:hypothetical protein [Anaerolineales bacterium]